MITAVDTNVLLDLLIPDTRHLRQSKTLLDRAYSEGALVISEIVYTELAVHFSDGSDLDRFLCETGITITPNTRQTLDVAAAAWQQYSQTRDDRLQCPECGHLHEVDCPHCGGPLTRRQHIVPDFLIGAHALVLADRLLTRDRGFYRRYFPELKLM